MITERTCILQAHARNGRGCLQTEGGRAGGRTGPVLRGLRGSLRTTSRMGWGKISSTLAPSANGSVEGYTHSFTDPSWLAPGARDRRPCVRRKRGAKCWLLFTGWLDSLRGRFLTQTLHGWLSRLSVSARVTISRFVSLSPTPGSVLTGRSLLGILPLFLSLCSSPTCVLSLSLSQKKSIPKEGEGEEETSPSSVANLHVQSCGGEDIRTPCVYAVFQASG